MKTLDKNIVQKFLKAVISTRPDELSCSECCDEIESFIEMELAGKTPAEAMPLVQDHLNRCTDCREEYEALLTALQNLKADQL